MRRRSLTRIARLYAALKEAGRNPSIASSGDARALVTPENWVRDYIQQHRNHYPELEECAETLGGALSDPLSMSEPMRRRLKEAWGISARVVPQDELGNVSQLYDAERRLFLMSSQLRAENRTFALAYQLALVEFAAVLDKMVAEAAPPDEGVAQLLHMSLANYAAGAIMMPYGRFLTSLPRRCAIRSTGCAASSAPMSSRWRTASPRSAAPARAACPSSCSGSIRPGTSPSATPATNSPSRGSAAPARAGTSTPPSRPPARSSPS